MAEELERCKERLAAAQATAAGCQEELERLRSARRRSAVLERAGQVTDSGKLSSTPRTNLHSRARVLAAARKPGDQGVRERAPARMCALKGPPQRRHGRPGQREWDQAASEFAYNLQAHAEPRERVGGRGLLCGGGPPAQGAAAIVSNPRVHQELAQERLRHLEELPRHGGPGKLLSALHGRGPHVRR
jgi:hypothetical protein